LKISDSCEKEKCKWWDDGKCPMYGEHKFVTKDESDVKITCDCIPKRTLALQMEMYNHMMGFKKYASQTRNMLQKLSDNTNEFMIVQSENSDHTARAVEQIADRQNTMMLEQQEGKE